MKIDSMLVIAAALMATLGACKRPEPPPAPRELTVGNHRLAVRSLAGWEVFDHGQQVLIKAPPLTDAEQRAIDYSGKLSSKSLGAVRLQDMGPVNRIAGARQSPDSTHLLSELTDLALIQLGHDQRRDIEYRKWASIGGREAEEVGTWQRQTHTAPRRFLFVINDGHLLAVSSEFLGAEESLDGYAAIRSSLQFLPTGVTDGVRR
jgi:hypothetical protein